MSISPSRRRSDRRLSARPSLQRVLFRANLGIALAAVGMAGLAVTLASLLILRVYADHNLGLIGRSMAYTVEAAVVFNDSVAAAEALSLVSQDEDLASYAVYNSNGHMLAQWTHPSSGTFHRWWRWVADGVFGKVCNQPILHNGEIVGEIRLTSSGEPVMLFLLMGLGGLLVCVAITLLVASYLSQRMVGRITKPLDRLAHVAYEVRHKREFQQRVPAARIAELNELGEDFNALLKELSLWQSHLKRENASLAHQASHDSLTQLPNRAFFESRLTRALLEAAECDEHVALLFIDTDNFKSINDRYGHASGDAVLSSIADRLRGQLRESDLVARLSGDEFAILLAPVTSDEVALRIADNIIASMRTPITLPDGFKLCVSLSIGVALYPQHGRSPDELLHNADTAMYRAKHQERGSRQLADMHSEDVVDADFQEIPREID